MWGHLNLNQLKAFYYAAQCQSFTLAAERLFISQPAVSMQIRALEDQYKVQLFIRSKKRLELTEQGRRLYRVAHRIFNLVEEAEHLLGESQGYPSGVLKIGSSKTLVRYFLSKYVAKFQELFPKVQIHIDEGSSESMVQSVLENRNDLAIVGQVHYDKQIMKIPFIQDQLVLLAAPNHRLCQKGTISLDDLKGTDLILREKGSGTRNVVERFFEERGLFHKTHIETGNVDFIKEHVSSGTAVTILARMGVDQDVSDGRLVIIPLKEGPFILDIDIVFNRARKLSNIDTAFIKVLKEGAQNDGMRYVPSLTWAPLSS